MKWIRYLLILSMLCVIPAHAITVMVIGGSSVNCPSYYASAILSMNFENGLNACDGSGNAVLFTDGGEVDIGAYGHTGQGMKIDDADPGVQDEYMTLTQSAQQYIDEGADQTICMKIKVTAVLDNACRIFRIEDGAQDDSIHMYLTTDNTTRNGINYTTDDPTTDTSTGTDIDMNTWEVVGISWQGSDLVNGEHAANPGDNGTWGDGWDEDSDELNDAMGDAPINILVGGVTGDPGDTEIIYIDEWAVVATYKFDCSTLFSPE